MTSGGKRPGQGRKPWLDEKDKASTTVQLRCTQAQKRAWKELAAKNQMTLSEWVIYKLEQKVGFWL